MNMHENLPNGITSGLMIFGSMATSGAAEHFGNFDGWYNIRPDSLTIQYTRNENIRPDTADDCTS